MTSSFLGSILTFHFHLIYGLISGLAHIIPVDSFIFLVKEYLAQEKGQILNQDGTLASKT